MFIFQNIQNGILSVETRNCFQFLNRSFYILLTYQYKSRTNIKKYRYTTTTAKIKNKIMRTRKLSFDMNDESQ